MEEQTELHFKFTETLKQPEVLTSSRLLSLLEGTTQHNNVPGGAKEVTGRSTLCDLLPVSKNIKAARKVGSEAEKGHGKPLEEQDSAAEELTAALFIHR